MMQKCKGDNFQQQHPKNVKINDLWCVTFDFYIVYYLLLYSIKIKYNKYLIYIIVNNKYNCGLTIHIIFQSKENYSLTFIFLPEQNPLIELRNIKEFIYIGDFNI
jgi:hypothetical protein